MQRPQSWRLALIAIALVLAATGCASSGNGLNSDAIRRQFGSYGVEILEQTEDRRVASLYSIDNGARTTRTYAVVEFLKRPAQSYRREHQLILEGGSVGETFRDAGWSIRKQSLFIGELEMPAAYANIGERMAIGLPATVAVHQYLFLIARDRESHTYARITEVHHPDFLSATELEARFGEIVLDDSNRDAIHDFIGPPDLK